MHFSMTMDELYSVCNLMKNTPYLFRIKPGTLITGLKAVSCSCMSMSVSEALAIKVLLQIGRAKFHVDEVISGIRQFSITVDFNDILVHAATELSYCPTFVGFWRVVHDRLRCMNNFPSKRLPTISIIERQSSTKIPLELDRLI
jgi:hypothetical protein